MSTPDPSRPAESWPDGAACSLSLTFDVDAETALLAESTATAEDATAMTHQAFGPRVGVPRLLRMLAEEGVHATFFVPGYTARRWPTLVEQILAGGHEVGHHTDLHRSPLGLTPDQERRDFDRALQTLQQHGAEVVGARAALWQATPSWLQIVTDHGMRYDSSMFGDDRPYRLKVGKAEILEIPIHWSLDDWEQFGYLGHPDIGSGSALPSTLSALWSDELEAQRSMGGSVVTTAHPFLSGRAARVEAIRAVIDRARSAGDVWIAPMAAVAERAATRASLRTVDVG